MIVLIPWKNPLNLGFADLWSFMNFTFTVSIGVTASIASDTPAPNPHSNRDIGDKFPYRIRNMMIRGF